MAWDGVGNFNRLYSWVTDKANGVPITASRVDAEDNGFAVAGFGNCLTRDGQGKPSTTLSWAQQLKLTAASGTGLTVNGNNGAVGDVVVNSTGSDTSQSVVVTGSHNGTIAALVQNLSGGAAASSVVDLGVSNFTMILSQLSSGFSGVSPQMAGGPSGQQAIITTTGNQPLSLGTNGNCGLSLNKLQTLGNAMDLSGRGVAWCRFKGSDTSRTSVGVPASDPDLTIAISAAGTYAFQLVLGAATPGASGNSPGLILQMNYSGTATGGYGLTGFTNAAQNSAFPFNTNTPNLGLFGSNAAFGAAGLLLSGTIKATTAGTLVLQWSQGVSSGTATTLNAGSYLTVTQLS